MKPILLLCAAPLALIATPSAAETAAPQPSPPQGEAAERGTQLAAADPILITGQRGDYGAKRIRSATKTDTAIIDIPQALTVISQRQVQDQTLRSVSDLLFFVPGATPGTGESNRDQFTLRGNNTTADLFIDGLRDDAQYFRDFYNIERVEVLKGPNAMIFGRGGGGGIVNRVLKRPSLLSSRELIASTGSEGGARLAADLDQAVGDSAGVRLNALWEDGRSFRRHVRLKRYGVNPSAAVQLSTATRLDLGYEYFHDRRTADRGLPSFSGRPLTGFTKTFFGDPRKSWANADVHVASLGLEHRFSDDLTLRNRTLFADYDKFYQNVYPNGPVADRDGDGPQGETVRLSAYNDRLERQNLLSQTDLVWDSKLGGIDHTLLLGFELGRQKGHNERRNGIFAASGTGPTFIDVALSDPTVEVPALSFLANGVSVDVRANIAALYVQEQLRPAQWLELVAGARLDRFDLKVDDLRKGASFERTDTLISPRLGAILKPADNLSLYASFSRSFLPQSGDQFSGLALNTESLKPERFDNYELGAKWEPVEGLLATAALYQLDRTNTRATDPADPTRFVLTGAQRTRGLELGLERNITHRWQVSAGYAWQDAEISKTTAAAPAGRKVPLVPRHSLSLWTRYDMTRAFGAGLGLIARSKSHASLSNQVTLPGYARVDGALYYKVGRGIEAQLNVENLFGARYFPTAHNDNNIAPGAPRTARLTLRYGF